MQDNLHLANRKTFDLPELGVFEFLDEHLQVVLMAAASSWSMEEFRIDPDLAA